MMMEERLVKLQCGLLFLCQVLLFSSAGFAADTEDMSRQNGSPPPLLAGADTAIRDLIEVAETKPAQPFKGTSGTGKDPLLRGQRSANANAGTVTIMTIRNLGGPFMKAALDLSTLLDSGDYFEEMRIIPVVARGKVQNLWDILLLKGIDVGFVQTDIFEYLKDDPRLNSIKSRVRYITVMFPEEVHIIARTDIQTLADLEGQKVSINAKGTGSSVVGTLLFRKLGINAELVHEDTGRAVARMKQGELAAHFNVLGKPARPVARIKSEGKLHLLSIPYTEEFAEVYYPSRFTSEDYPELIPEGEVVNTIAAGNVLAVFNWPRDHERYRKVARFVDAFFTRFDELSKPGFHPKWKEVNLAAEVPGWTRFGAAQKWLDKNQPKPTASASDPLRQEFEAFVRASNLARSRPVSQGDVGVLFKEFLEWRKKSQ